MTCSGFYQGEVVRSPTPGQTTAVRDKAWMPCRLRSRHDGPCGPEETKDR